MSAKIVAAAIQADVDVCNALEPPVKGCHAGSGIHIVIPPDFVARIAAAQDVPGCSYARLDADGSLYVDSRAQAQIAIPAVVSALSAPLQGQATALIAKLAAAAIVPGS
jgi:hypothetical protein